MGIRYATREDVKRALDSAETARTNTQIDRALDAATDAIHGLCHRQFYPWTGTKFFDWPDNQMGLSWRLWLDANELVSLTSITSAGVAIAPSDYLLEPQRYGPPYNRVEINLGTSASFGGGPTHQRDISIFGVWAGCALTETAAGTTTGPVDASTSTMDVTDSAAIGVGDLIRVDSERMTVAGKRSLGTGQTLQGDLAAQMAGTAVPVNDGTLFAVDETILIDAERMLIVDVAGNTLIVQRAWDGSALAAHTTGAAVYASRTLLVERGAAGTTIATHNSGASIFRHDPPALVERLAIAESLVTLGLESAGYARTVRSAGAATNHSYDDIDDLRDQAYTAHGRKVRKRAV